MVVERVIRATSEPHVTNWDVQEALEELSVSAKPFLRVVEVLTDDGATLVQWEILPGRSFLWVCEELRAFEADAHKIRISSCQPQTRFEREAII